MDHKDYEEIRDKITKESLISGSFCVNAGHVAILPYVQRAV